MELLDYLAEKTHCQFMSDLHYKSKKPPNLQQMIERIPLSDFPESEWIDAAQYICNVQCANASEAKSCLTKPRGLIHFR